MSELFLPVVTWFWALIGMAKWDKELRNCTTDRAKVLWEEANLRRIPFEHLFLFGRSTDIYRAKIKGKWNYFTGLPRPKGGDTGSLAWMDDKNAFKLKLVEAGIPAPRGGGFFSYKKALEKFRELQKPIVVKPRFGSRGRHTTTFVFTEEQFKNAFYTARKLCPFVMVEEQLLGPVYRGTVIGGKVRGVLSGEPPRIVGDGIQTIEILVQEKNKNRDKRVKEFVMNSGFDTFLARQNYSRATVLPKGKVIDLTEKIGISYGGKSAELTPVTHPKFIIALEKAAALVADPILGFDFIALDVSKDADSQRWGIIECNGLPFINLHHDPLEGEPRNIAASVWDLMLNESSQ